MQAPLLPLLRGLEGAERLIDVAAALPEFDVQAALMSLPYLFRSTPATVPADVPYLSADPNLVRSWGDELAKIQGLKIGVAWQGNPDHVPGLNRSIPLAAFEPLARLPGVRLINLQKGPGYEQIAQVPFGNEILDLSSRLDERSGAFMDTAAMAIVGRRYESGEPFGGNSKAVDYDTIGRCE